MDMQTYLGLLLFSVLVKAIETNHAGHKCLQPLSDALSLEHSGTLGKSEHAVYYLKDMICFLLENLNYSY